MPSILHIPTDPPGEIDLELAEGSSTVRVERRYYDPPSRKVLYVPLAELWKLLTSDISGFRFEDLSVTQLRSAVDFARERGWNG